MATCKTCGGRGSVRCPRCDGKGQRSGGPLSGPTKCSNCGGAGVVKCGVCKGKGQV